MGNKYEIYEPAGRREEEEACTAGLTDFAQLFPEHTLDSTPSDQWLSGSLQGCSQICFAVPTLFHPGPSQACLLGPAALHPPPAWQALGFSNVSTPHLPNLHGNPPFVPQNWKKVPRLGKQCPACIKKHDVDKFQIAKEVSSLPASSGLGAGLPCPPCCWEPSGGACWFIRVSQICFALSNILE